MNSRLCLPVEIKRDFPHVRMAYKNRYSPRVCRPGFHIDGRHQNIQDPPTRAKGNVLEAEIQGAAGPGARRQGKKAESMMTTHRGRRVRI